MKLRRTGYHLVIETPKANLVDGMKWFQTTYTRRFNVKNGQWGHLFGGRYKAIVVQHQEGDGTSAPRHSARNCLSGWGTPDWKRIARPANATPVPI